MTRPPLDPIAAYLHTHHFLITTTADPNDPQNAEFVGLDEDDHDNLVRAYIADILRVSIDEGVVEALPVGTVDDLITYMEDLGRAAIDPCRVRSVSVLSVLTGMDTEALTDAGLISSDPRHFTRYGDLPKPSLDGYRQAFARGWIDAARRADS